MCYGFEGNTGELMKNATYAELINIIIIYPYEVFLCCPLF